MTPAFQLKGLYAANQTPNKQTAASSQEFSAISHEPSTQPSKQHSKDENNQEWSHSEDIDSNIVLNPEHDMSKNKVQPTMRE
jgi:hypothetical protein